jgi:hypothetical protein
MFIMMDKMANDVHETRSKHTHIERQQDMGHEHTVQGKKEKEKPGWICADAKDARC